MNQHFHELPNRIGKNLREDDVEIGFPQGARRLDEFALAQGEKLAAHDARH